MTADGPHSRRQEHRGSWRGAGSACWSRARRARRIRTVPERTRRRRPRARPAAPACPARPRPRETSSRRGHDLEGRRLARGARRLRRHERARSPARHRRCRPPPPPRQHCPHVPPPARTGRAPRSAVTLKPFTTMIGLPSATSDIAPSGRGSRGHGVRRANLQCDHVRRPEGIRGSRWTSPVGVVTGGTRRPALGC